MEKRMEDEQQTQATANAPRPFIYVRSAANEGNQLQQRVEEARELARMQGLDVAQDDITAEYSSGARTDSRPGLQSILEQVERGQISHLVTSRVSNLSRNDHDLHQIFEALADAGVKVVTGDVNKGLDGAYAEATAGLDVQP